MNTLLGLLSYIYMIGNITILYKTHSNTPLTVGEYISIMQVCCKD